MTGSTSSSYGHEADETASGNAQLMHTPGATPFLLISPTPLSPLGPCHALPSAITHHRQVFYTINVYDNDSHIFNDYYYYYYYYYYHHYNNSPSNQPTNNLISTHPMAALTYSECNMAGQNLPPCPGPPPTCPLPAVPTKSK
ncbi:hypothetical protein PTRG_07217 [Pyrenophora tritici-repentis Pt-1C-BFP]|uniref:Uncharacterized protein n=1 Tax=Pyrenophora tritici-repentis (strain Pt-1C-BFP) TaxID=426418 RepID=B2WAA4_PYRTR|nr:uncharacterized protein PTRG_07217 [Pyrenophora tritici-repentis Pt-1C-BFP]EDU50136.1 hypothetical protein PTRG_07217 [Pyrenophora tritici-repentis Pt-1C-BFP]